MNDKRRKQLRKILDELESISQRLESVYDEEYDAWNNVPENLSSSDQSEESSWSIDLMRTAVENLDVAIDKINDIFEINEGRKQLDQAATLTLLEKIIHEVAGE